MRSGHDEIKAMLPEYLKGFLSSELVDKIEAHLKDCQHCREELSLISEILSAEAPDPGDVFWETLPQRVRESVKGEIPVHFSLRRFLFRPLLAAVTVILLFFLVFVYVKKKGAILDPFFKDPLEMAVLDYSEIDEKDIPAITQKLTGEDLSVNFEDFTGYSYHREFASLSAREMDSLYEKLKNKQRTGG